MLRKRLAIVGIILCTIIVFSASPTNAQEISSCRRIFENPEFTAELARGQSIVHYITMIFPDPFPPCGLDQPDLIYDLDLSLENPPGSVDYERWYDNEDNIGIGLDWDVSPGRIIRYPSLGFESNLMITVPDDARCGVHTYWLWAEGTYAILSDAEPFGYRLLDCQTNFCPQRVTITVLCDGEIPLFSDAVAILPMAAIVSVLIVRQRKPKIK